VCDGRAMAWGNETMRKHLRREAGAEVCGGSGRKAHPDTIEKAVRVSPPKKKGRRRSKSVRVRSKSVRVILSGLPGLGRRK
jgi:hypothetical protein